MVGAGIIIQSMGAAGAHATQTPASLLFANDPLASVFDSEVTLSVDEAWVIEFVHYPTSIDQHFLSRTSSAGGRIRLDSLGGLIFTSRQGNSWGWQSVPHRVSINNWYTTRIESHGDGTATMTLDGTPYVAAATLPLTDDFVFNSFGGRYWGSGIAGYQGLIYSAQIGDVVYGLNEGSGTAIEDSGPGGNDGTLNNVNWSETVP